MALSSNAGKKYAIYFALSVALGAVVGTIGYFVSNRGHDNNFGEATSKFMGRYPYRGANGRWEGNAYSPESYYERPWRRDPMYQVKGEYSTYHGGYDQGGYSGYPDPYDHYGRRYDGYGHGYGHYRGGREWMFSAGRGEYLSSRSNYPYEYNNPYGY